VPSHIFTLVSAVSDGTTASLNSDEYGLNFMRTNTRSVDAPRSISALSNDTPSNTVDPSICIFSCFCDVWSAAASASVAMCIWIDSELVSNALERAPKPFLSWKESLTTADEMSCHVELSESSLR